MPPAPANILNNRSAYIPPMASKDEKAQPTSREDSAYYNGSSQAVIPTKLTVSRLETRRKLTKTSDKLVIVLVGLPARGKSFISRKLLHYVNWTGVKCQAFNVGKYRRKAYAEVQATASSEPATDSPSGACDANFFSAGNTEASALRQQVAQLALDDMLAWLDDDEGDDGVVEDLPLTIDASRHSLANMSVTSMTRSIKPHSTYQKVAIFDATNSTEARRRWVLEECTSPEKRGAKKTGIVFVESICTDQELLVENYRFKVSSSPDYKNMSIEEGLEDLLVRVRNYEAQYETIQDDNMSYIKIFDLSTKLMVNHIYGRMAKDLVPALMAWHIGSRPVYLIRPGRTNSGVDLSTHASLEMQPGPGKLNGQRRVDSNLSFTSLRKSLRNDGLSQGGRGFREALWEYLHDEVKAFISKRSSVQDNKHTGTSMSGLEASPFLDDAVDKGKAFEEIVNSMSGLLPLRILASTMPRALETVSFEEFDIPVSQMSNLNPIDKGDFAGLEMDGVKNEDPSLYSQLQSDPFHTRFPGGESYCDLLRRLNSVVIDIEQQVVPVVVVSHVSTLQCLMAYFRNTNVKKCMLTEVPMHTVIKFEPARGGGWQESWHPLSSKENSPEQMTAVTSESEFSAISAEETAEPIWWGESAKMSPTVTPKSPRRKQVVNSP